VRKTVPVLLLVALLAGCLGPDGGDDADLDADLVLLGGQVWTGDEARPWADAVAITGGRLSEVGTDAQVRRHIGDGTRVVELDGAFVMPGLRDHHAHVLANVIGLEPGRAAEVLRPAPFIESETEAEIRHEQDFATQLVYHGSRGIDARIDEDGRNFGPLSLYEACGEATGEGAIVPPTQRDLEALMAAETELASQGLTTIVEAQLRNMTHVAAVLALQEAGLSKIRWQLRVVPGCYPMLDALGINVESEGDWLRLLGVKLYADGYLGAWIAALREPYSDRPFWTGVPTYDADTFLYRVNEARERGLTVGTHAIGDASAEQALDAYEAAGVTAEDRYTIEHAQVLGADLVQRMADDGIIASIQYSFSTTDQHFAEDRLGPDRLQFAYIWKTLAESGVVLAGGSDYPIEVITPLWGIQRVVTRAELDGSAPWLEEEALTVEQALKGMTWGQAYASKEEADRGTLTEGKAADITVLKENPMEVAPDELASGAVMMTIVNGKVTFEGEQSYPPPSPWAEAAVHHDFAFMPS
jgi:predicted amidohydrolase YtcJ